MIKFKKNRKNSQGIDFLMSDNPFYYIKSSVSQNIYYVKIRMCSNNHFYPQF